MHGRCSLDRAGRDHQSAGAAAPVLGRGEGASNIGRDVSGMYCGRSADRVRVRRLAVDGGQRGWCVSCAVR